MADVSLRHIYKVYPNGTKAVNDFNMEIADKEFIVFVGPSGCGKSTTLRMIAGLEDVSAGELKIGDLVVNDMEPKDRDIAMVFQNYALYPHMTVYENIAFGLRLRKLSKEDIHKKVTEAAEILGITEYLGKKPKEMSGGQRQRVALGRAIVREPKVMLLDEPLSNLDAKLRTQMRAEIAKLHQKLQTTFIYVTHDQVEAMTMGTRIVVMKNGFVQQIDTPKNLYRYPANKFVAGFIGTPQMNFFEGTLTKKGDGAELAFAYSEEKITLPKELLVKVRPDYLDGKTTVYVGLRAEDVSLAPEDIERGDAVVNVKISHKEELGSETLIYGDINMGGDGYMESSTRIIVKDNGSRELRTGEVVKVALNVGRIHLFDRNTEESILPRIPAYNYVECEITKGNVIFLGQHKRLPSAMECSDGAGELLIPADAISLGGEIAARVISCEEIGDRYLLSAELGGKRLFALLSQEVTSTGVNLTIDWKKVTLARGGMTVLSPMPAVMKLEGKLVKIKNSAQGGKPAKKQISFGLAIADAIYPAPDGISSKLLSSLGVKKAFEKALRFECSPYDFHVSDSGITATVSEMLDYGTEKFAVCKVGEQNVLVAAEREYVGTIHINPDLESLSVVRADLDIRLI